jgi:hypothetical protein
MVTWAPRTPAIRATQKPWPPPWKWISQSSPVPGSIVTVITGDGANTAT